MEGQGVVDLDHPRYYNGGKGILLHVMRDPAKAKRFAHLKDKSGKWVVRKDVWVRFSDPPRVEERRLDDRLHQLPGANTTSALNCNSGTLWETSTSNPCC